MGAPRKELIQLPNDETVRVAAVQASGPFLDRERCLEQAVGWIEEAGRRGVQLVAFPEGFVPGHPVWYHFHPVTGRQSLQWAARLFDNSVVVGGRETNALAAAAKRAGTHVVIGVCEKRAASSGTMFNTQVFIDDAGRLLGKRQKLVPTVGERIVHAPGTGDMFPVFATGAGRVSGLLCGENANPLAVLALASGGTQIHVASWPNHFSSNEHAMVEAITFNTLALSYQASCFVINACGVITDELRELLPYTDGDAVFLSDPSHGGGSSILGATSRVLAGPMPGDDEGLLVADLDLEECVQAKVVHDYSGHYNRADVFTLTVRPGREQLVERAGEAGTESARKSERDEPDRGAPDQEGRVAAAPETQAPPTTTRAQPIG